MSDLVNMHNLEAEIEDAIDLTPTQLEPDPTDNQPEQPVTIYDFGKLMDWSEPTASS